MKRILFIVAFALLAVPAFGQGRPIVKGSTDQTTYIRIIDSADGTPETGVTSATGGLDPRLRDRIARVLVTEGALRRVGDALVLGEALDALKAEVRRRWASGARLDVGAFKDMTRLSRKYVIPLLEYLDREKVTRRSGADRVVM